MHENKDKRCHQTTATAKITKSSMEKAKKYPSLTSSLTYSHFRGLNGLNSSCFILLLKNPINLLHLK